MFETDGPKSGLTDDSLAKSQPHQHHWVYLRTETRDTPGTYTPGYTVDVHYCDGCLQYQDANKQPIADPSLRARGYS